MSSSSTRRTRKLFGQVDFYEFGKEKVLLDVCIVRNDVGADAVTEHTLDVIDLFNLHIRKSKVSFADSVSKCQSDMLPGGRDASKTRRTKGALVGNNDLRQIDVLSMLPAPAKSLMDNHGIERVESLVANLTLLISQMAHKVTKGNLFIPIMHPLSKL